jgi:probable F420-dependent oxidoreductase
MVTAYTAWDLQRYSQGRFRLGLGTQVKGHNERRFGVPWDRPGPRLRDLILALRTIWGCWQERTRLDYQGEFYRLDLMTPFFDPGPQEHPHIPIYIAGVNPYVCRLAGELCDGFHVHPMHTVRYIREAVRPMIAEGARRGGRDARKIELASACFVVRGDNDKEIESAARSVKQQIAFYASTRTYVPVLAMHGWEEVSLRLNELSRKGKWVEMAGLITDEMLAEFAVIGRSDQIGSLLRTKYEGVLDRIALYLPFRPGADEDWWREIVARLN